MRIKTIIASRGVISFLLLGSFYGAELMAQGPLSRCDEVAGSGLTSSAPAAVSGVQSGFSILDIFVRGTDSRIYENAFTHSGFPGWSEVPGGGFTSSGPAAVLYGNILKLFVRGFGNGIWENDFDGANWSGWSPVPGGGLTLSGPAAVVYSNILKLFVRGTDDRIYENDFNSANWSGWSEVSGGGLTLSTPAPVVYSGVLKLFVHGIGNGIHENDYNGTSWSGWSDVPGDGLIIAGPSGLVHHLVPGETQPGILKLFVTNIGDGISENDFSGSSWSGWFDVSGGLILTPLAPAAVEAFNISPFLLVKTEEDRIFQCSF